MKSYLLLEVNPVFKEDVKRELQKFDFTIDKINDVGGSYNVIARVVTDNKTTLNNFIHGELDSMLGVKKINTISISS